MAHPALSQIRGDELFRFCRINVEHVANNNNNNDFTMH